MSSGDLINAELRDAPQSAWAAHADEPEAIKEADAWGSKEDLPRSVEKARQDRKPMFDVPTPLKVDVDMDKLGVKMDSGKASDIVSVVAGASVLLGG